MAKRDETRLPLWERLLYAVPVIGWMLKDVVHGEADNIWWFLATLVMAWAIAGLLFGYPGVIIPALILAPAILIGLVVVTRG